VTTELSVAISLTEREAAAFAGLDEVHRSHAELAARQALRAYLAGLGLLLPDTALAVGDHVTLTFPGASAPVELPAVVTRVDHPLDRAERGGLVTLPGPYTTFRYTLPDDRSSEIPLLNSTLSTFVKEV
jgi:hypothetical protein